MATTRASQRVEDDIKEFGESDDDEGRVRAQRAANPVEPKRQPNPREANVKKPKKKRKATAAQMKGLAKARAALKKKYGTANIGEIVAKKKRGGKSKPARRAASKSKPRAKGQSRKQRAASLKNLAKARRARGKPTARRGSRSKPRTSSRSSSNTHRSSSRTVHTIREKVIAMPKAGTNAIRIDLTTKKPASRKGSRSKPRRRNPIEGLEHVDTLALSNPYDGGSELASNPPDSLFSNPDSPFGRESLQSYGIGILGVGLGLVGAKFLDRYLATRTPVDGKRPWYGRDAALAQRRRPDAMRLVGQGGLALGSIAIAYFTRDGKILPWLFAGTAVGAGAYLVEQLVDWWVAPAIFKVEDWTKESFASRMFPYEQASVQDPISQIFEKYKEVATLGAAQMDALAGLMSPLSGTIPVTDGKVVFPGTPGGIPGPVAVLGQPPRPLPGHAARPVRRFVGTGATGVMCPSCGAQGGHWDDCNEYLGSRQQMRSVEAPMALYEVGVGDNLTELLGLAGVPMDQFRSINGNRDVTELWRAGNRVYVPFALGRVIQQRLESGSLGAPPPAAAPPPAPVQHTPAYEPPAALAAPPAPPQDIVAAPAQPPAAERRSFVGEATENE